MLRPMIITSPYPPVDIPERTITEFVLEGAAERADDVALTDGLTGRDWTFAEFEKRVRTLAGGLVDHGVGPGSVVALIAPNCPEFAIAFHAIATAGGTVTTVNPAYTPEEMRFQLVDSGATIALVGPDIIATASEAVRGTEVQHLWSLGTGTEGVPSLDSVSGPAIGQVPVNVHDHVVVLPYSSGTTGLPKGVMLTHRNLVANLVQTQQVLAVDRGEIALAVLPFFHIYGMQVVMNGLLAYGARVITLPRFDLPAVLQLIASERVTRFFVVPPIVLALAKHPMIDEFDLSSLRYVMSGAAPLGAELTVAAQERIGCSIGQGYGMTELSPVALVAAPGEECHGTSGRLLANTQMRLVDVETGADAKAGEPGELWFRGPQVMSGYLNNPGATTDMLTADGWLKTGDIAIVDDRGYVTIVDRVKELIKVKGFQVAPAELEALLQSDARIADAAVVGIADEEAGERPKAYVVRRDPGLTEQQVCDYVAAHTATYKHLAAVEFVESVPKSASGKILRRMLRSAGR